MERNDKAINGERRWRMKRFVQYLGCPLGMTACLFLLCLNSESQAFEEAMYELPRTFEGAQLGMSQSSLAAQARAHGKLVSESGSALSVRPKDRRLAKINYRFHGGALRQIEVKYKPTQIPGGYESLVQRLKDVYGRPQEDNGEQWDPRPEVLSLRKTVWTNATTQIAVTETRRIEPGEEPSNDLVLTMTDRALESSYQEEQMRRRQQAVSHIPIPLPDAGLVSKHNGNWREAANMDVRQRERLTHSRAGL
jgi:hypothetical protein